jgi:hypothetical protein
MSLSCVIIYTRLRVVTPDLLESEASLEEVSDRSRLPFTVGASREGLDLTFRVVLFLEGVLTGEIVSKDSGVIGSGI